MSENRVRQISKDVIDALGVVCCKHMPEDMSALDQAQFISGCMAACSAFAASAGIPPKAQLTAFASLAEVTWKKAKAMSPALSQLEDEA